MPLRGGEQRPACGCVVLSGLAPLEGTAREVRECGFNNVWLKLYRLYVTCRHPVVLKLCFMSAGLKILK